VAVSVWLAVIVCVPVREEVMVLLGVADAVVVPVNEDVTVTLFVPVVVRDGVCVKEAVLEGVEV